jgi:hypothetical protein
MKLIKTYENYNLEDLNLGRFSEKIDKSKIIPNSDGAFDYYGDLKLHNMKIKSLTEIPIKLRNVHGNFYCNSNFLTSLQGSPSYVGGHFFCNHNQLTNLLYAPSKIVLDFDCNHNLLTSLEGASLEVGGNFNCFRNLLISLQYTPSKIGGYFWCWGNNLLSKKHLSVVKGDLNFSPNPLKITDEVIETVKQMTFDQRVKELDFFEKNDKNAFEMMKEILDSLGLGYGEETKNMIDVVNKDYTSAKNLF